MTAWEVIKQAPRKLGEAATRPQLVGIDSPQRRMSSLLFGIVMVMILVAGLVGVLVLSTALQTREFELRAAQRTADELGFRVSDLESQVNRAKAPLALGRRATDLGMVPNPHSVFIDLGSGQIKGEPVAATGNEIPSLRISPVPTAVPSPEADAAAPLTQAGGEGVPGTAEGPVADQTLAADPATTPSPNASGAPVPSAAAPTPARPTQPAAGERG